MSAAIILSLLAVAISLGVAVYASRTNMRKPNDRRDGGDGGTSTTSVTGSSDDCGSGFGDSGACDGGGGGGD